MVTFKSTDLKSKKRETPENGLGSMTIEEHTKFKNNKLRKVELITAVPLNNLFLDGHTNGFPKELRSPLSLFKPNTRFSQNRASSELEVAAIKVQKAYKGYRTRRSLADCAVVVEELWFVLYHLLRGCLFVVWNFNAFFKITWLFWLGGKH